MANLTKAHPALATLIDEHRFVGKEVTLMMVDFNVDADGSRIAVETVLNTIQAYGNILIAGAVYGTGQQIDIIMEGSLTGSDLHISRRYRNWYNCSRIGRRHPKLRYS